MSHSIPVGDKDPLRQRLRQEAQLDRPLFCPELHARLVRAVQKTSRDEHAQPIPAVARGLVSRRLALALAAGLLLALVLPGFWARWPQNRPAADPDLAAAMETVTRVTRQAGQDLVLLSDATTADQCWAQLDHDLPLAWARFVDRLPRVPGGVE
mgnify:FL=1